MSHFNNTIIEPPPARQSMSTTRVINLVDDDSNSPPAIRRRITEPAHDDDIIILDDDHTMHNRRVVNGTANRPIVISDNNREHSRLRDNNVGSSNHRRSYRIFSPSPSPPMHHPIPPVPQIPPPVIANGHPFAILAPPQTPEDTHRRRLPFDEPPQPSTSTSTSASASTAAARGSGIQLGGGLVSQGLRPRRGQASRSNDAAPGIDGPSRAGRIVATFLNEPELPAATAASHNNNPPRLPRPRIADIWGIFSLDQINGHAARFFGIDSAESFFDHHRNAFQRRDEAVGLGPDYTKDMTHPGAPPPGWSFNFGTEDVDVDNNPNEKTKPTVPSEVLVCAMCLDPLYVNIDGRNDLSAEEKKRRRIWALRCGHMFDGKCMETFMAPTWTRVKPSSTTTKEEDEKPVKAEQAPPTNEPASEKSKGKGKEKVVDEVVEIPRDTADETKTPQVSIPSAPTPTLRSEPEVQILDTVPSDPASSRTTTTAPGARYNLRTRRTRQEETPTTNNSPSRSSRRGRAAASSHADDPETPSRRGRGTKRKFEEKVVDEAQLRKNEARYNWTCRVAGCGKKHSSYNWQGEWKPDEENGPIAVYI
ncbi:hypothetical protein Clacol_007993 [Clathrus columnatus]|uniref:Uncharacterized protein n=1 Tax=Clathrus columnatus TaxID=1419009 RepID=A0AAV5AJ75_9AGAM|nr:hypothetical protein Clacol_007993 [Clathrus columnatus]